MKNLFKHIFVFSLFILPVFVLAQGTTVSTSPIPIRIDIPNPTTAGNDLMSLIVALLNKVVMPIAGVAVVIYIIWAGFCFITAQGVPAKINEAKQRLLWALIGSGILLGAAGISAVVERTIREVTSL